MVPLQESSLALVGTLLVLTIENATTNNTQGASEIETAAVALVGPGPATAVGQSLSPVTGSTPTLGGKIEEGGHPEDAAHPVPPGARPWEDFVIGLDENFDQFRREFLESLRDEAKPQTKGGEAPSPWDDPTTLWLPDDRALDRRERGMIADRQFTDHSRVTDEAIHSLWSEDATSSHPWQSGSQTSATPVRVIPAPPGAERDVSAPTGPVRRGGGSPVQLPDPEGARPLQVSLLRVALALAVGRTWPRRRRWRDRFETGE